MIYDFIIFFPTDIGLDKYDSDDKVVQVSASVTGIICVAQIASEMRATHCWFTTEGLTSAVSASAAIILLLQTSCILLPIMLPRLRSWRLTEYAVFK